MTGPGARRQHGHNALVECRKSCRISLAIHEVSERGRQTLTVLVFRDPARTVGHGPADIEHHMAVEIRFFLEFLHVVAIAARVDLPVDRRQIVTRQVLAVLGELDAESFEGTAVEPREKPFDNRASFQLEGAEARHNRRIEKLAFARAGGHSYIPLFGRGTVSSSRSTIASELMRSDSA